MRRAVLLPLLLVVAACGGGEPSGADPLPGVRVVVTQGAERLVVRAEVAATPAERARGLMNRTAVPAGSGMLFLYPAPVRSSFWMKNTLVELHVLFIRDGRVVEIRNMRPCVADPCPRTTPAVDYDSALEVPIGTLGRITVGARVEIFGRVPSPA